MRTADIIAEMLDSARKFNLFFLSKIDPAQFHHRPVIDGRLGNSAYWIACHLVWAEASGLIGKTGGTMPDLPWIEGFMKGGDGNFADGPAIDVLLKAMADVHAQALAHVRSLSDEDLAQPAFIELMNWNTTRQKALYHFIRHESFHGGQIALIARSLGADTP
jgi:DinB superfamily